MPLPRLLLAALAALAGPASAADPPAPPKAPPPKPVDPAGVPADLADWTPRPAVGKAAPWEKATDKDWVDGRFRNMDTGRFLNATFKYPAGKRPETVTKGTAIRLGPKGDAGVLFDRNSLRLAAGWTGGYLQHSDRRFGLLNTPTPAGELVFGTPAGPGWAAPDGTWDPKRTGETAPLPREWARYRGLELDGDAVRVRYVVGGAEVADRFDRSDGSEPGVHRLVSVGPSARPLRLAVPAGADILSKVEVVDRPVRHVLFPPADVWRQVAIRYGRGSRTSPGIGTGGGNGPRRRGPPVVTTLVRGSDAGPFAVDTLTLPYDNPHRALFFCTGLDHLPDGRLAVCTAHGDVWLATVDEAADTVAWQRFATGLYHPLGLRVVAGKVVVLERGQLTRLHDNNSDGEADFYECVTNDWDTGGGEHAYDTCLETDPAGNFYFFKTGDTHLPTGGCLLKVAADGSKCEVAATGFRHPIGLGVSPTGVVTGADQEGNWMPATRVDQYKPGGFYGDMRAHHRAEPPTTYDGPLCWLPREVDNSAGGQVWVPADAKAWGPLAGKPLHLSYGRCKAFVLLRDEFPGGVQGGVWDLGLKFLAGVCRGRFGPAGHLYVCGLNGWQTAAQADGCVQRVRPTGKPFDVPVGLEVVPDGVKLTFSRPLDRAAAADPGRYRAAWWDYKWAADYGSKRYKPSAPGQVGQDDVPVAGAEVLADGRTVHVKVPGMRPVMQMQVGVNLRAADGAPVVGSVYLTVHHTGK